MTRRYRRAAFFDMDETLIAATSLLPFLRFHFAAIGRPPSAYAEAVDELRGLVAHGASRTDVVRAYYRRYAGQRVAEVTEQGRAWFHQARRSAGFFVPDGIRAFHQHRRDGDLTVLVSGSFAPCMGPIAGWLRAGLVFGAHLDTVDGRYTGEVITTMIGTDKAVAARSVMRTHGIRDADCYAYGDHVSDLPLLYAVGYPVVVGDDPTLAGHAEAGGWPRLRGAEDPS